MAQRDRLAVHREAIALFALNHAMASLKRASSALQSVLDDGDADFEDARLLHRSMLRTEIDLVDFHTAMEALFFAREEKR